MGINFWGVVYGTKAFLPHLKASGEGHVVNLSSVFGLVSVPSQSAYNAAKFAVRGFTDTLRMELEIEGAPVSVTTVHPGGIKTNIARNARMDQSVAELAGDAEEARADFERLFVTSPEKAARQILGRGPTRPPPRPHRARRQGHRLAGAPARRALPVGADAGRPRRQGAAPIHVENGLSRRTLRLRPPGRSTQSRRPVASAARSTRSTSPAVPPPRRRPCPESGRRGRVRRRSRHRADDRRRCNAAPG